MAFHFLIFCVEPDWHSIPAIGSKEQPPVKYCVGCTNSCTPMAAAQPGASNSPAEVVVDPVCVQQITDLLNSKKPVNQLLDQVVNVLSKYGLAYTSTLTPGQLLCHPPNRSKGMVNCLDMWDKGAKMLKVGMSRQLIGHSLAIELAIDPVKRQDQVNANSMLVQEADGGLAPISGQERFLALHL